MPIAAALLTFCSFLPQQPAPGSLLSEFHPPERLRAGAELVKAEGGYAAPCWHDVDRDGQKDLIVGQLDGGQMRIYCGLGGGKLAPGKWLEVSGAVAEVPDVW